MPAELSDDDLDALAARLTDPVADNVAAQLDSGWHGDRLVLSRRQVLALGGMGLSATGLMALGVDRASAQSAAGQVGTSSEPVDVEAASVNAQSVSTGDLTISEAQLQARLDGYIVPTGGGVGISDAVDPADFANPVNEAISRAPVHGRVLLPYNKVEQDTDLVWDKNVAIVGENGVQCGVKINNPSTAGIHVTETIGRKKWGGFEIEGPGDGAATPPAFYIDKAAGGRIRDNEISPLMFRGWGDTLLDLSDGNIHYGNVWQKIVGVQYDATYGIDIGQGPPNVFQTVELYPTGAHSGSNGIAFNFANGGAYVGYLGFGNASGKVLNQSGDNSMVKVEMVQYEPSNQQSEPFNLATLDGLGTVRLESIHLTGGGSTNHVIQAFGGANKYIGPIRKRNLTVNGEYLRLAGDTSAAGGGDTPVTTALTSADVANDSGGTLTEPVVCLGDLTTVS